MVAYEYATTVQQNHPIMIPFQYTRNISDGSKVRILIIVEEEADLTSQQIGTIPEEDDELSSLEDFMTELRKLPPTDHLLVPGDGRLAEYLANPVIEPDPDFDVDEWNLQWQTVEEQMKEEDKKYEQRELDRLQRLMS